MNIKIRNSVDKPIYEQIAEAIKDNIVQNLLQAGEPLPSIRLLAKDLSVSVITTKRAYEELERDGFIETVPGKGSFVKQQDPNFHRENYLSQIQNHLEEILVLAQAANISKEEIIERYSILEEDGN